MAIHKTPNLTSQVVSEGYGIHTQKGKKPLQHNVGCKGKSFTVTRNKYPKKTC
jgi:hypothetical protein